MENRVSAMTDAEILAGANRDEVRFDGWQTLCVGYFWPDGFKFGSRLDETCDAAQAERDAIRVRREWLEREAARGS